MGHKLLLTQVITYVFILFAAIFTLLPLKLFKKDFKPYCPLYAQGIWFNNSIPNQKPTRSLIIEFWGNPGVCQLTLFLSTFEIFTSIIFMIIYGIYYYKKKEPSWLIAFIYTGINIPILILSATTTMIFSMGVKSLCKLLLSSGAYKSCWDFQRVRFLSDHNVHTDRFFVLLRCIEIANWMSLILWTVSLYWCIRQMVLYSRREAFIVSLNRERQKILQKFNLGPEYQEL